MEDRREKTKVSDAEQKVQKALDSMQDWQFSQYLREVCKTDLTSPPLEKYVKYLSPDVQSKITKDNQGK